MAKYKIYTHCPLCKNEMSKELQEKGVSRCEDCIRKAVRYAMEQDKKKKKK